MDNQDPPLSYGDWLKQRRKTLDLTQAELAGRAGCSVFALRKIESGERRPSKQLARLLAEALDVPVEAQAAVTRMARGEVSPERLHLPAATGAPPLPPTASPVDNLPVNLLPLLGREPELAALSGLLHDPLCRLLTLIGAGGIGKTRLAIEAAAGQRGLFADGVCFVPLAPLTSPAFLVSAIAGALGISFQGQVDPHLQLLDHLHGKQMLLVLDNLEHLLDGVGLLVEILERVPKLKLLVTSRERLNLQSEWVFVVQGLAMPPLGAMERVEEYPAIQLFTRRARRARVGFVLHDDEKAAAIAICRMVEGMPLGIELAAAWVSVLTCREIARELERGLDFLATSVRDVPERQRSLRAVFDHSWKLLTEQEQTVLCRLTVFQGGFGRQAAAQIVDAGLPLLWMLVSKSLVRHHESGRYDLHEVIRQYALPHFATDPACEATRARHSRYYLSLLRDREQELKGAGQREAIRELKEEMDNVRAAWAWAIRREEFTLIGQALRSFGWLCNIGVLYREGVDQIESVVHALRTRPDQAQGPAVLGIALAQQGLLYFRQGRFDRAQCLYEESLAILRPLGDPALLTDALVVSGVILFLVGEIDQAKGRMVEGFDCAGLAGDRSFAAYALFNLGYLAGLEGRYAEGYEQMLAGLAQWRELGDPSSIAMGLNHISPTAIHLGRLDEAQAYLQESLALLTQVGDLWGMGTAYRLLGLSALAQGDTDLALAHIRHSLEIFQGYIIGWDIAQSLNFLGRATLAAGDVGEARRLLLDAFQVAKETRARPIMLDALATLAELQMQTGEAEAALRHALLVLSHPSAPYEAKERADRVCVEAATHLTSEQARAAGEWRACHSLESANLPDCHRG